MQVILDSSFARPGSAPIRGGKEGEFRDWTIPYHVTGSCKGPIVAGRREAISVLDVAKSHHIRTKGTKRDVQTLG